MAKKKSGFDPEIEALRQNMPEDARKNFDAEGIKTVEDLMFSMIRKGYDPMKLFKELDKDTNPEDFNPNDYAIDKGSDIDFVRRMMFGDDEDVDEDGEDVDEEDEDLYADEDEEDWYALPEGLLLDGESKEYHIRIKLNNAPVPVWRELRVPSNISLELLAQVIIEAMGWYNSHLHQFRKGDTLFKNTEDLKESMQFIGFGMPRIMHDANKFSLGNVLKEKGDRMQFEYDFGDSWTHDVWVKGIREYDAGEEPEVVLLKGKGACPPEDCGGVWGYSDLLTISQKKRKTKEEKERLEWYGIDRYFKPETFGFELAEEAIEDLWWCVKDEMEKRKDGK